MLYRLEIHTPGQGLHEITAEVERVVHQCAIRSGLVNLFLTHTSAGLIIQENADPSAREDLERWMNHMVPGRGGMAYSHTLEGPDDMPAHIKAVLTGCSLTIPLHDGTLGLGTWQGIYLWEHRRAPHRRRVVITVVSG